MPRGRFNVIDLQSAIELYTPIYQLLLTDNDFWRASNSLQLDETVAIYCAKILAARASGEQQAPMVPLSTLYAAYRLVLHGLSTEMLHCAADAHGQRRAPHAGAKSPACSAWWRRSPARCPDTARGCRERACACRAG
jgi:hypothetical protein